MPICAARERDHGAKREAARRELAAAAARQQEGELAAVRQQAATLERKHRALLDQLAELSRERDVLAAEAAPLRRLAAEHRAMRDEHAAALELLGEKEEELEAIRAGSTAVGLQG